jgi:hypothetical protein
MKFNTSIFVLLRRADKYNTKDIITGKMKQILNALIVFILMIAALNVTGQDQAKAEQAVKDYLSGKYTNYTAGVFDQIFEQDYPSMFQEKMEKTGEIKYTLTHNYSLGDIETENEFFFFDKDYNLLGQLSSENVGELFTVFLMDGIAGTGLLTDNDSTRLLEEDLALIQDSVIYIKKIDYSLNPVIGLWSDGESYYKFKENGLCEIITPDDTFGDDQYTVRGEKARLTYVIDYNTSPVTIDIVITSENSGQEFGRALGILLFINYDKIKLRMNSSESGRPQDFLPPFSPDILILNKVAK